MVELLRAAVVRRRKVRLVYANRARDRTERLIDQWGLVDKDDVWYVVAGTDNGQRTFRVDRIVEAVPTDLPAVAPADFALADAWSRVVDEVEAQRSTVSATVLVPARCSPSCRTTSGANATRRTPSSATGGSGSASPLPPR
jgi:predicted DNA-binding transcriptional regulator YafY